MKTAIYIILLVIGILAITFYLIIYTANPFEGMCGNAILKEVQSPNKKHTVVIFTRDCGATTHYSTQLSILDQDEKLENEAGNILVLDFEPKVEVRWKSDNELIVSYDKTFQKFKEEDSFDDIEIIYLDLPNKK